MSAKSLLEATNKFNGILRWRSAYDETIAIGAGFFRFSPNIQTFMLRHILAESCEQLLRLLPVGL